MGILLQYLIAKLVISRIHPFVALSIGLIFIGGGIGTLFWASSFFGLIISGSIFVLGELLILPTIDSTISQLSKDRLIGLFLVLAIVFTGIGAADGIIVGCRHCD